MNTYRLYFNRERDWPQCWSIDEGTQATEINVCGFQINGVVCVSRLLEPEDRVAGNVARQPFAWLELRDAVLRVRGGFAIFSGV